MLEEKSEWDRKGKKNEDSERKMTEDDFGNNNNNLPAEDIEESIREEERALKLADVRRRIAERTAEKEQLARHIDTLKEHRLRILLELGRAG